MKLGRHDFRKLDERARCVGCKIIADPVYVARVKTRGLLQHKKHPKGAK